MSASNRNPSNQNQELSEEQEENIKPQQEQEEQKEKRLCDFCGKSRALLYCRADLAKLCFQCDREVHSTNPLFTKHTRFQLCDYCDSNPASIHCSTDNLVLCQNCDWESHRCSSSLVHDRRPLEGFTGCPSGVELSSILGFDDLSDKSLIFGGGINDGFSDSFVWEMSNIVRFDDLIVSSDSNQALPAIGVPPLPKNLNTVCGKHKEEMIRQLCDILRFETCWKNDLDGIESFLKFEPMVPEQHQHENMGFSFERKVEPILPSYEVNSIQWQGDNGEAEKQISFPSTFPGNYNEEENFLVLDNPDGFGFEGNDGNYNDSKQPQHPIIQDTIIPVVPKITPKELSGQDRELMLSRYKEKRKTRRYEKHIRYESRKVRAETRTRIKGRFAKISN